MADKKGVLSMTGDVTAAQATLFQRAVRSVGRRIRRARATAGKRRAASGRPRAKRATKTKGPLKKGSPAAKRRMAQLRRMQKK